MSQTNPFPQEVVGNFYRGKNGVGYVRNRDLAEVIEIPANATGTALHRDRVRAKVTGRITSTSLAGSIIEIERRSQRGFAGKLVYRAGHYQMTPEHNKDGITLFIPESDIADAKVDDFVFVELVDWKSVPIGRVTRRLEPLSKNDQEMLAIILSKGFDDTFPESVTKAAEKLYELGIPEPGGDRRDLRSLPTFTIDPDDAKDFDDALSWQSLGDGKYQLGIHIADVSYYVQPGTPLDDEAIERATSVYLVDRVIPMLPEVLSNDLCSLRPNEDRAAFSALFVIDMNGQISERWFGQSLIHSDKRFTYREAQEVIDTGKGPFADELRLIDTLSQTLRNARAKAGALMLESDELKFTLDEDGKPLSVHKKETFRTQQLIEECMLIANRETARFLGDRPDGLCVYRVHPRPGAEKVADLEIYLRSLGFEPRIQNGIIPNKALGEMIAKARSPIERGAMSIAIARSMEKAFYTTAHDEHYGLGFHFYTHFTSPIRRYPDILTHRLLVKRLAGQSPNNELAQKYEGYAVQSNARELDAAEAERASVRNKQMEYLRQHIDTIRDGIIVGMTERGLFVRDMESYAEGMVRLADVPGDYYSYNPKTLCIEGRKTNKKYRLGDPVTFQITKIDQERGFLDFKFVDKQIHANKKPVR